MKSGCAARFAPKCILDPSIQNPSLDPIDVPVLGCCITPATLINKVLAAVGVSAVVVPLVTNS